jgi:hypothetical protein
MNGTAHGWRTVQEVERAACMSATRPLYAMQYFTIWTVHDAAGGPRSREVRSSNAKRQGLFLARKIISSVTRHCFQCRHGQEPLAVRVSYFASTCAATKA